MRLSTHRRCDGAHELTTDAAASVSREAVLEWMRRFAAEIEEQRAELVRLDTAIGDADHGTNMDRGMRKALVNLETLEGDDIGGPLKAVGMALVSSVGGAAGPLYGTLFLQMGAATTGADTLDLAGFTEALEAGVKGVQARGRAEPGDKTMVDALLPAVAALREAATSGDTSLSDAAARAAAAAEEGMKATIPMEARKGRASYLGPRSVGHQDPGATSSYLLLRSAGEAFTSS
jgi:phosphoenolpyruvate---glycerone phosphotransferase subunit DhaL